MLKMCWKYVYGNFKHKTKTCKRREWVWKNLIRWLLSGILWCKLLLVCRVNAFAVSELWLLNRYSIKQIFVLKLLHLVAAKINWFINEMQSPFFVITGYAATVHEYTHIYLILLGGFFAPDFHWAWIRWFITECQIFCYVWAKHSCSFFLQHLFFISANWI